MSIVTLGFVLLAAACGGSPSSNRADDGGPTTLPSAKTKLLEFTHCMRSHDVPNFPDPDTSGEFPKATLARIASSNAHYPAATRECAHLLPASTNGTTPALAQEISRDEMKFMRCMRSHGVPNWPEPTLDRGRLVFKPQAAGIDTTSPQISAQMQTCDRVFPASVGVPPGAGYNPGHAP